MDIKIKQVWSYIIRSAKPFPLSIFVMFLVSVVWSVDLSVRPYLLKIILNRLAESGQTDVFHYIVGPIALYLLMYVSLTTSFRAYGYFVEIKMIPKMREKIATDAFGLLVDKSHNYYQNNFSGSLTNKVNDLTSSVPDLLQIVIDRFFCRLLALFIAIFTLWQVSPIFAIQMLIYTSLLLIASLLLSGRLARQADTWSEYGSVITGKIVDALSNILSIRLFAAKRYEKRMLSAVFDGAVKAEQKLQWSYFWMWFSYGYTFFILQILNFYFLCKGRQEGWITVGDFALVLVINISIIDFLLHVANGFSQFSKLLGRITQALRTVLEAPELTDQSNAIELKVIAGQITFDNVKFHYKGTEPLFQNKSIEITAGQKVGLVGYSGSGKSTFVNLILRLYDLTDGAILIDGQDIRDVTQDSLRENIAMIPQDPSLFHRNLMENISYGRIDATDKEVIEAAKKAHAHEFISALLQGYDSLVGERGVKLSGGQRQRIAIARAILKNSPILILDEATSQLDSVTESLIQESLWELMQNKTTIVIAHRLSTLLRMDRILVFDKGKIVEDGTHSELLAKSGLYKHLWDAQVGGFLGDEKTENV
ncbi:ABC transporter permease [Orientia tsutsugamushi]|uniref:ABC transporter permease n=1 Tax=Orientia tsutsugamushi TaxID=784 RepID=A0A2R8EZW4_ORITS|nr:ABC transporter ATP-binding protein [Orientia tsutsugamushi]SPM44707.1 ABC transporter permease [Orientia tsutsugamushi]